ncbi:unnamed protein product [Parajaminaea phylloscopi]
MPRMDQLVGEDKRLQCRNVIIPNSDADLSALARTIAECKEGQLCGENSCGRWSITNGSFHAKELRTVWVRDYGKHINCSWHHFHFYLRLLMDATPAAHQAAAAYARDRGWIKTPLYAAMALAMLAKEARLNAHPTYHTLKAQRDAYLHGRSLSFGDALEIDDD